MHGARDKCAWEERRTRARTNITRASFSHRVLLLADWKIMRFFSARNNVKEDIYRHENAAAGGPSLDLINSVFNQNQVKTMTRLKPNQFKANTSKCF